jgi:hypothetical protein
VAVHLIEDGKVWGTFDGKTNWCPLMQLQAPEGVDVEMLKARGEEAKARGEGGAMETSTIEPTPEADPLAESSVWTGTEWSSATVDTVNAAAQPLRSISAETPPPTPPPGAPGAFGTTTDRLASPPTIATVEEVSELPVDIETCVGGCVLCQHAYVCCFRTLSNGISGLGLIYSCTRIRHDLAC